MVTPKAIADGSATSIAASPPQKSPTSLSFLTARSSMTRFLQPAFCALQEILLQLPPSPGESRTFPTQILGNARC
ncbi:MAG: hypothetical protein AW07_04403 [Candidatus Accumulibacter sp. SK-11]|nr:MAG: hypothetical protein AW07_04403 [Candidatus Accumulibacter sp. SK-11]